MDPELAMALRVSMEEERARQEAASKATADQEGAAAAGGGADPAAAAAEAVAGGGRALGGPATEGFLPLLFPEGGRLRTPPPWKIPATTRQKRG